MARETVALLDVLETCDKIARRSFLLSLVVRLWLVEVLVMCLTPMSTVVGVFMGTLPRANQRITRRNLRVLVLLRIVMRTMIHQVFSLVQEPITLSRFAHRRTGLNARITTISWFAVDLRRGSRRIGC